MHFQYVLAVIAIASGSIPKGYDEGGFSASINLSSFVDDFNLDPTSAKWLHEASGLANVLSNINSFGVLGTAIGAGLALVVVDRFGRLRCWQGFTILWATGLFAQVFASGILGLLYFSRIWSGLGMGGLTVVVPLWLTEIALARSRGMAMSAFMVILLGFLSLGFFINYGASLHMAPTRTQYRLVQVIPIIPMGVTFIWTFFLPDSPRWLAAQDRHEDAKKSMAYYRCADQDSEIVAAEMDEMYGQLAKDHQTLYGVNTWTIVKECLKISSYRRRLILGLLFQTVAQWSGGNGITYYIGDIFKYAGISSSATALVSSGAYGLTKLVFTMVFAWVLVDRIGRRPCFLLGLTLQLIAHIYLMFYNLFLTGKNNTSATDFAIFTVFLYAGGWSIGMCTVQFLYATEIFPTRIRGVCYAFNLLVQWFFQFAVVRVILPLMVGLHVWGGFLFFATVCIIGIVVLFFLTPETKRVPMERMDDLFDTPWYAGWKGRVWLEDGEGHVERGEEKKAAIIQSENVG